MLSKGPTTATEMCRYSSFKRGAACKAMHSVVMEAFLDLVTRRWCLVWNQTAFHPLNENLFLLSKLFRIHGSWLATNTICCSRQQKTHSIGYKFFTNFQTSVLVCCMWRSCKSFCLFGVCCITFTAMWWPSRSFASWSSFVMF